MASFLAGGSALSFLYTVGVLVLLSVATYRAAILPHWTAYLVAALAVIVFGEFGVVLTGLVWIALGYVLFSPRGETAGRSSRVT